MPYQSSINMPKQSARSWLRAIALVDMNCFFAAIEQHDNRCLRDKPIAVTNGIQGTCIITCSYEARHWGIKTGMRLQEAYRLCPDLIQVAARPQRYSEISKKIMLALQSISPDVEVFSVDEAFLDLTHCQLLQGRPEVIGQKIRQLVWKVSGLPCSVGVSGDKTTAKFAAGLEKPNGLQIILPWEAKQTLATIPVNELCGIGQGISTFLARHGVYYCGDIEKLPISILAKRFGNLGRRIWYMCQGMDFEPVYAAIARPKSMGHGKVLPPDTKDDVMISTYLMHMCEKLAVRLRSNQLKAQHFFIGLKHRHLGWLGQKDKTPTLTDSGSDIYSLGKKIIKACWHGESVCQIQVTALDPQVDCMQLDLFYQSDSAKAKKLNAIKDEINARYGKFTIAPALLLARTSAPDVISPAWRPDSHRQSLS